MKSEQWKTYRTRFLVKAKRLSSTLSFTDHLGRTHCGRKGDYLVESYDGVVSIAPRQIFEDIYVPMMSIQSQEPEPLACDDEDLLPIAQFQMEPLKLDVIPHTKFPSPPQLAQRTNHGFTPRLRRKSPQPTRSTRPASQMGFM